MPRRKLFVPRRRTTSKTSFNDKKQHKSATMDLEILKAATDLFIISLKHGSSVDIYFAKENCFYEAWVKKVERGGFHYIYKNKKREGGFALLKDCLSTWRPPMDQRNLTPEAIVLMYDDSMKHCE